MSVGCGGKPASKNRMNKELSDFASRLREIILSFSNVGDDVRSLILQNRQSATPLRARSREIGVGNRQLSGPPHQPSSDYGTAGVGCRKNKFNALALELFALQFKHNAAYRKICEARLPRRSEAKAGGLTPKVVEHWTQIPTVPTAAFKELDLTCLAPAERTAVFHSSGTTEQKPSRHYHSAESLNVYEASLISWFLGNVLPDLRFTTPTLVACSRFIGFDDLRLVCLTPPSEQAPHSSLVHMFETVRRKFSAEDFAFQTVHDESVPERAGARFGVPPSGGRVNAELQTEVVHASTAFLGTVGMGDRWTLDFDRTLKTLREAVDQNCPLLLLGTAFSFVHLLDYLAERNLRFDLPAGSRVMETGGYKNRSRSLPKTELHQLITDLLGVLPENIICEYGMSELSSQAYDDVTSGEWRVTSNSRLSRHPSPVTRHFYFPPWARAQIISPETGREVADGETGLIRVFDLANVFSVMAIQTEDLGIRRGEHFELIGRAQLAEPRGCSLMAAETRKS